MRFCAACGSKMTHEDGYYLVTPAANGVGEDTVECLRHFPTDEACHMVEEMFGLPYGLLTDDNPFVARGLRKLAATAPLTLT